jgi:hypothetical protein
MPAATGRVSLSVSPLDWAAPAVDREVFLEQGFLIVDCIPGEHLERLRSSFGKLTYLSLIQGTCFCSV